MCLFLSYIETCKKKKQTGRKNLRGSKKIMTKNRPDSNCFLLCVSLCEQAAGGAGSEVPMLVIGTENVQTLS